MPEITAQEYKNKIRDLKEKATPEFLETLTESAKLVGWLVDYSEVTSFIRELYSMLEINFSSDVLDKKLDPYEIDYNSGFLDFTKENN